MDNVKTGVSALKCRRGGRKTYQGARGMLIRMQMWADDTGGDAPSQHH